MSLSVVRNLPEDRWRRFVEEHPAGNIYHTPEMFEVYRRARGYSPELWAVVDGRDCVQALFLPVVVTLKDGVMRYLTTRAVAYGSVLSGAGAEGEQALAALLKAYRARAGRGSALFTELRHVSDTSTLRPVLESQRFRHVEELNYMVDLNRPEGEIWKSIDGVARSAIKRGMKRGAVVEELRDRTCLPAVHSLLELTYRHAQVPAPDLSLIEAAFDVLVPRGMLKINIVRGDGEIVAAKCDLLYKDTIYAWYNGWNKEHHVFYPNDILTWEIIRWGAQNGYHWFNMGGAGNPHKEYGPRKFKAKYNGQLVNHGRATCVHRPVMLAVSTVGYEVYRKTLL